MTDFKQSETRLNLLRAFAGESQARNRYTFAAGQACTQKLYVLESVFTFTAGQEKEHAEIFYNHLKPLDGEKLTIEGSYPINLSTATLDLLRAAIENEYEENSPVYPAFADTAEREGFAEIAAQFRLIADIEKTHGDRFAAFATLMEKDQLFRAEQPTKWMCLNCGHVHNATEAPKQCPVCAHPQGYFIREAMAPFTGRCN